ncbi:MAG: VWA domain-containing protein [Planctomycetes bacterium]|nr:VWA domain-containing protein [Planctomycetota bacterium]NOG55559.1 VWA domain-containing protein [Planctomycetota bacterium]
MMSRLSQLVNLSDLPPDVEQWHFAWDPLVGWLPPWLWPIAILLLAALAVWSYRGLLGPTRMRYALASIRIAILVLILFILAGPTIVFPRERTEPDTVAFLLDRSRSMTVLDVNTNTQARTSRDAQMRTTLGDLTTTALSEIQDTHRVAWIGFDSQSTELFPAAMTAETQSQIPQLGEPGGNGTNLGVAIDNTLTALSGRPISALVVLSDGRQTSPLSPTLVHRLQSEHTRIIAVPHGSREPIVDYSVATIEAPQKAFIHDRVPVRVRIDRQGIAADGRSMTVQLIDEASGRILDQQRIESAPGQDTNQQHQLVLTGKPAEPGMARWRIEIKSESGSSNDLLADNDAETIEIDMIDRPLRVLFIEGYPRWEYRYFKNMLIRERSIDSSVILLSADRDFAQEGNTPVTRMPMTAEELDPYDIIVIGDVPADVLTPDQAEAVRTHVAEHGAGLLWMAGPRSTPGTYQSSALATLLPLRTIEQPSPLIRPTTVARSELARRLGMLDLLRQGRSAWPTLADSSLGWTELKWIQQLEPAMLKPAVEVLAQVGESIDDTTSGAPAVITHMRYGSGASIYIATDEFWRWRYGHGELLPEQVWIQLIRMLGRNRVELANQAALLRVDPRAVEPGTPCTAELRLLDSLLVQSAPQEVRVAVELDGRPDRRSEITLLPDATLAGRYAAGRVLDTPGTWRFTVIEPSLAHLGLEQDVQVRQRDAEFGVAGGGSADWDALESLAQQTGGVLLTPDQISELAKPGVLPNRSVRIPMDVRRSLWDSPLCFILVFVLLVGEWVGRRLIRLA